MDIVFWVLFGAIVGWLASIIAGADRGFGLAINVIIGISGAIIGGAAMSVVVGHGIDGFNVYSLLVAIIGSVTILSLFKRNPSR